MIMRKVPVSVPLVDGSTNPQALNVFAWGFFMFGDVPRGTLWMIPSCHMPYPHTIYHATYPAPIPARLVRSNENSLVNPPAPVHWSQIGRASCRERV